MKEQTNYDYEKYVQIAQMAKMGWWESDLKNKEYICSDFIVDLLGLESNRISFTEFHQRIREDHRLRLKNEYMSLSYLETYEQMFPIRAKDGEIWVYSKIIYCLLNWLQHLKKTKLGSLLRNSGNNHSY